MGLRSTLPSPSSAPSQISHGAASWHSLSRACGARNGQVQAATMQALVCGVRQWASATGCAGSGVPMDGWGGAPTTQGRSGHLAGIAPFKPVQDNNNAMICLDHPQVIRGFDTTPGLHMSTLRVDEHMSRLGIHHDPPCPLPALMAGSTVWAPLPTGG